MPESDRRDASPSQVPQVPAEQNLAVRLRTALGARATEAGQSAGLSGAAIIGRLRSGGAAMRAAAPDALTPGQALMVRLRPSRALEKAADQELRPLGFGLYGAIALDFIARQHDPPRLADIARFLMQEPQSLTALIRRLERRGWVRRQPSQRDRRAVLLELTEAGRQLHQKLVRVLEGLAQDGDGDLAGQPSPIGR
ncbi:MAG: MarR family winged helix-turn-helix transcriptional regulator [Dehalococcoidia bacterium]